MVNEGKLWRLEGGHRHGELLLRQGNCHRSHLSFSPRLIADYWWLGFLTTENKNSIVLPWLSSLAKSNPAYNFNLRSCSFDSYICLQIQNKASSEMERSARMTWVDYFSSLGGLFGLCLGFSIISFIEVSISLNIFSSFQFQFYLSTQVIYWAVVKTSRNVLWTQRQNM